jgi:hypothetical protein
MLSTEKLERKRREMDADCVVYLYTLTYRSVKMYLVKDVNVKERSTHH